MRHSTHSRRQFLQASVAAGAGLGFARLRLMQAAETAAASALVAGKSDALQVLKTAPLILETPRAGLQSQLTSLDQLFVRNNQDLPGGMTLAPFGGDDWSIELTGLVNKPAVIDLKALRSLPTTDVEMVLQCSGNGRAKFSETAKTEGTQWGRGGMGNVAFQGVKLTDVLHKLGVEPRAEATYLCAEGRDGPKPGEDDFEHSLPLGDVLETALFAVGLNGQPLPLIHGGPVRLVVPGYYATMNVKWLSRLRFESAESRTLHHAARYRMPLRMLMPGSEYEFTLRNSTPTWKMKIGTLVASHPPAASVTAGRQQLAGWAWNDGRAPLTEILISRDQGTTWTRGALQSSGSLYAWHSWNAALDLPKGRSEVWIRAVDALGRTQPVDGAANWNPHGYEWHGVEKIVFTAT